MEEKQFKVAISTYNRPDDFKLCYENVLKYVPKEDIIIVGDNNPDYIQCDYAFKTRVGIPRVKNKCIELFMQTDADHLFLLDDDTWPTHEEAFKRYIESPYLHLCYTFLPPYSKIEGHKLHGLGNGCCMYLHRSVIEKVGGFDTAYQLGKYEHVDISRRIYNAGLTPYKFIDVQGSDKLWYCLDQEKGHKRSFTEQEMSTLLKQGKKYFLEKFASTDYVSYL